jgi:DNA transformation protein and related proteins
MSSDQKTVDYLTEQMAGAGDIRSRMMFGEYVIYCDDKVVALVCDNQLFFKVTETGRAVVKDPVLGPPYPGAKNSFVIDREDWEDVDYLCRLARVTTDALPQSKKK